MLWKPKPLSYRRLVHNPEHRESGVSGTLAYLFVMLLCALGAVLGWLAASL